MSTAVRSMVVNVGANTAPYVTKMGAATRATQGFATQTRAIGPAGMAARGGMLKAGGGAKQMGSDLGLLNPKLLGPAGLVYGLGKVVGAAIEWESAFAGVQKTVEGTDEQLAAVSAGLREMSTEIPVTAGELAGVAEAAGQLGIQTDSVVDFTRVMADLGVATNMTSEEAATALARFANITQMAQDDFDRLGATVVDLGNNAATTEGEIVDMSLRLAGASNQAGLTEAEILGLSTALSSVGIRAEAGGTAFSKVMIEISEAASEGGEQLELLADVAGMSAEAFATLFEEDPAEAVIRFVEGLGAASDAGESLFGIFQDLGIEEIRMRDALLRTAGAGDVLRDAMERGNEAWSENIALTEEAERRYETTASQWQIFKNNVKDVATSVGEDLLPVVEAALGALNDLAGFEFEDDYRNPDTSDSFGGFLRDLFGLNIRQGLEDLGVRVGAMDEADTEAGRRRRQAEVRPALEQPFGISDAEEDFLRLNGQLDVIPGNARKAAAGIGELEDGLDDAEESARTAADALEGYMDWVSRATDPVYNLIEAVDDVAEAEKNYNDVLGDSEASQKDAEDAALEHLRALDRLEAAAIDGDLSFENFESRLQDMVATGKLTADAADLIRLRVSEARGEAELFSDDYVMNLIARTETAEERLARVRNLIAQIPSRIRTEVFVDSSAYNNAIMNGGPLAEGGTAYAGRAHLVGEEGPELFVPGMTGTVIPATETSRIMGGDGAQQPAFVQQVYGTPDSETLRRAEHQGRLAEARRRQSMGAYG